MNMKDVHTTVKSCVLLPFIDTASLASLRQVSREFASLTDVGELSRIRSFCLKKFTDPDFMLNVMWAAHGATSSAQLVEACRPLVHEALQQPSILNVQTRRRAEDILLELCCESCISM